MKIKILHIFTTIFFLIIFFVFYKGLQNSNIYVPKTEIEKDIPLFSAQIFGTNNQINSEDIFNDSKFYLVNIWASWCVPCRAEHSFLLDLNNQKNLEIIGLNYKDKKENADKFLYKLNNPYTIIISDRDGTIAIEWGAFGVPESFLIYDKKIIKEITGPIDKDSFLKIKERIK